MPFWKKTKPDWKSVLTQYATQLNAVRQPEEVYRVLLRSFTEQFKAGGGSVLTFDFELNQYVLRAHAGSPPLSFCLSKEHALLSYFQEHLEPLSRHHCLNPDFKDSLFLFFPFFNEWKAEWVFPLIVEKQFLGLLNISAKAGELAEPYSADEVELMTLLVGLGAAAIDNVRLHEAVQKQGRQLEEMTQLKNQFLKNMTHEFRNPLHTILGMADLMADEESNLNAEQRQYVKLIQRSAHEQLELLDHILDLTQYQSGLMQLEIRKLNLKKIILEIYRRLQDRFQEQGCQWQLEWAESLPDIYGDEREISHLILQLFENALKFSPRGTISVSSARCGEMLKICVRDTGVGISPEDQGVIFEAFRQSKPQTERPTGGSGLGLAVAKKIVELHGGRIWVESKPQQGTQFYFTLPTTPSCLESGGKPRN